MTQPPNLQVRPGRDIYEAVQAHGPWRGRAASTGETHEACGRTATGATRQGTASRRLDVEEEVGREG